MSGSDRSRSSAQHSPEPGPWDSFWNRRSRSGSLRDLFGRLNEGESIDDLFKPPHDDADSTDDSLISDGSSTGTSAGAAGSGGTSGSGVAGRGGSHGANHNGNASGSSSVGGVNGREIGSDGSDGFAGAGNPTGRYGSFDRSRTSRSRGGLFAGGQGVSRRAELRRARRRPSPTPFSGFFHHKEALDRGLASLQNGLGMTNADSTTFSDDDEPIIAKSTASVPSTLIYAPDMDGQADSGEVVWIRGLLAAQPDREMPVVILGHHGHHFRALLISTNKQCASDDHWFDIGSGGWDVQGRQAWVRLDKTLEVPEHKIRRRGTVIPRHRFNRIAQRLRADYNWR